MVLAGRIEDDLSEIWRVMSRASQGWDLHEKTGSCFYVESVAFNLHSFYVGLERIFLAIVREIDGGPVEGPDWHRELLRQMTRPIPLVRPGWSANRPRVDWMSIGAFAM